MKKLLLFFLIFSGINNAQSTPIQGDSELFFYQDGGNNTYKFTPMIEAVWDKNGQLRSSDPLGHSVFDPIPLGLTGAVTDVTNSNGMDHINSVAGSTTSIFGNSLYKV